MSTFLITCAFLCSVVSFVLFLDDKPEILSFFPRRTFLQLGTTEFNIYTDCQLFTVINTQSVLIFLFVFSGAALKC